MTVSVTTVHDLDSEIVTVRGELDLQTAPELRAALVAAIDATEGDVLVDLTDVSFVDSTALAAFVAARAHAETVNTPLELVCANPDIQRVFAITGLSRVFRMHDHPPARRADRESADAREVGSGVHSIQLDATDEAPAIARKFVSDNLTDVSAEVYGDLQLLVSEVVTNAVRYGGSELELRLSPSDDLVRVEVQDPGTRQLPDAPESVAVTAGCGRGLFIVDSLASRWGVEPVPDGVGKVVWFELPRLTPGNDGPARG